MKTENSAMNEFKEQLDKNFKVNERVSHKMDANALPNGGDHVPPNGTAECSKGTQKPQKRKNVQQKSKKFQYFQMINKAFAVVTSTDGTLSLNKVESEFHESLECKDQKHDDRFDESDSDYESKRKLRDAFDATVRRNKSRIQKYNKVEKEKEEKEKVEKAEKEQSKVKEPAKDKPVEPKKNLNLDLIKNPIEYKEYESELQMHDIMCLIQSELSEPYSIYTYRYFLYNWPKLCFLAMHGEEIVGAIVCKLDMHKNAKRGYIAMLAVHKEYRKLKIGTTLVQKAIDAMLNDTAEEVVLETEVKNVPALRLYQNLGFVREKRLFRYYLNGVDALRLKLWFK